MSRVRFAEMDPAFRTVPRRLWPSYAPWFHGDGEPTAADLEVARKLFLLLDPLTRLWYARVGARLGVLIDEQGEPIAARGGTEHESR